MYRSPVAFPYLISVLAFRKPLTKVAMKGLVKQHWKDRFQQKNKPTGGWKNWFRRGNDPATASTSTSATPTANLPPTNPSGPTNVTPPSPQSSPVITASNPPVIPLAGATGLGSSASSLASGSSTSLPIPPPQQQQQEKEEQQQQKQQLGHNYVKSVRLTHGQLESLNLQDGPNIITFEVEGKVCTGHVYLWSHNDKVVISDIDGTITKSDTLGHIFTAVGKDWTHSGVANLYTNIAANGYKILYVTSRAIGQSSYTKEFLKWVEQSGGWRLPDGPCLCAPDRLLTAFHREVIQRKPQEFKIAVLQDVCSLFEDGPFYAGFGNRITDSISYKTVGVPIQRIFTINPQGDIKAEVTNTFKSSYASSLCFLFFSPGLWFSLFDFLLFSPDIWA